jgi:hypothetical protein
VDAFAPLAKTGKPFAMWRELCGTGGGFAECAVGTRPDPVAAPQRQPVGCLPQPRRRHTAGSDLALRGAVRALPYGADPTTIEAWRTRTARSKARMAI